MFLKNKDYIFVLIILNLNNIVIIASFIVNIKNMKNIKN